MNRFLEMQEELLLPERKKKEKTPVAQSYGRAYSVPRGIRNNNPGNIEKNKANDWLGKVPPEKNTDSRFEQFTEYKYGVRALIILLYNYIKGTRNTLTKIFAAYAPPAENNTKSYIDFVARRLGIGADDIISPTKQVIKELAQAIGRMENGQEAVTDAQFEEGYKEVPEAIRQVLEPAVAKSWEESFAAGYGYDPGEDDGYPGGFSVAVKPRTLIVVENSANDKSQFLTYRAKGAPGSLRPTSTEDMVNKILASLKEGEKIERLEIFGHGYDGYISVGAGELPEAGKRINGNPEWEPHLKKLRGKFTANAEVYLWGCHTGAGADGAAKLKKLADLWGVAVTASTGLVYANESGAWWEEKGAQRQRATHDKPAPPALPYPSDLVKSKSMSAPESLSLLNIRKDITTISLHRADKPLPGEQPQQASYQFSTPGQVEEILSGIQFSRPANIIGLASIINARIFFTAGGKTEEFVLLGGYQFIAKRDDRQQAYTLSAALRERLRNLIEKPDLPIA